MHQQKKEIRFSWLFDKWKRCFQDLPLSLFVLIYLPLCVWMQRDEQPTHFVPNAWESVKILANLYEQFERKPIFVISDRARAVALQPDGKIVVAGESDRNFTVVRYLPTGALDPSFGTDGKVVTSTGLSAGAWDLGLQTDGKIVIVGRAFVAESGSNDFVVIRYNSDGSLDSRFGNNGIVTTDFSVKGSPSSVGLGDNEQVSEYGYRGPKSIINRPIPNYDDARTLVIQPSGKMVVGGTTLVRYNPDGSLDISFAPKGQMAAEVYGLALQEDGKIVVTGKRETFALTRHNADGSLDSNFGVHGTVSTQIGKLAYVGQVALQLDGKLVVVGRTFEGHKEILTLVRYHPDGSLDQTFGRAGIVRTTDFCRHYEKPTQHPVSISVGGARATVQQDGKIVVATFSSDNGSCPGFTLLRYNTDGSLDRTFGTAGKVTTFGRESIASALVIQPDGKIVVIGSTSISDTEGRFVVVRYNPDGSLDRTFGKGGKVITRIGKGVTIS